MGISNTRNVSTTDWLQMTVKELLAAANIHSPGSNLQKKLEALYGYKVATTSKIDDYTMEKIIDKIDNRRDTCADEALVCLADTFVEVNRQVCEAYVPDRISPNLRAFYYAIFRFFYTILKGDTRGPMVDMIYDLKEDPYRNETAMYFPIINIISALLATFRKNWSKSQKALDYLYIIIVEYQLGANSQNKP